MGGLLQRFSYNGLGNCLTRTALTLFWIIEQAGRIRPAAPVEAVKPEVQTGLNELRVAIVKTGFL